MTLLLLTVLFVIIACYHSFVFLELAMNLIVKPGYSTEQLNVITSNCSSRSHGTHLLGNEL